MGNQASEHDFELIELFGDKGLFTNERVRADEIPSGLFKYDLRGSDDDPGRIKYLERNVWVNHAGTIIMANPIHFSSDFIDVEDEINFVGEPCTLDEFVRKEGC